MIAQVACPNCGRIDINHTETLNIEEGMMGEDLVTFRCCICGEEATSTVTTRFDGEHYTE